jgi:flagellar hook-basal body complex protein FliE
MPIPAIGAIAAPPVSPVTGPTGPAGLDTGAARGAGGSSFATELGHGLQQLQQTQAKADDLAVKAATGDLTDVHDYMIASTEASLATQLTVAVRNKAVEAFNEIMRMQA